MTRVPPTRVVQAATAVRTTLQSLTRRMVPPEIALLEARPRSGYYDRTADRPRRRGLTVGGALLLLTGVGAGIALAPEQRVTVPGLDLTRKEVNLLGSRNSVDCFPEALALLATLYGAT